MLTGKFVVIHKKIKLSKMIIGITGSIGSGKTTVSNIFRKHGFKVIEADKIGHGVLNKEAYNTLKKKIEEDILFGNKISRKRLGKIVFKDKRKLKTLNMIMWPLIIKRIKEEIKKSQNKNIVIDSALIIESEAVNLADSLIVVKINKGEQIKRLLKKGRYSLNEIREIINAQIPQREKLKYADYIIDNSGDINNTKEQALNIINELKWKEVI